MVRVGGPAQVEEAPVEPSESSESSSWDGEVEAKVEALEAVTVAVAAALEPPVEFAGAQVYEVPEGARVYSASSMGECTTALVARGIGYPPADMPEVLNVALKEGNRNEPRILERLGMWHLLGEGEEERAERKQYRVYVPGDYAALGIETGEYDPDRDVDYCDQPRVWLPVTKTAVVRAHLDGLAAEVKEADGARRVVEAKAFGDAYWDQFQREGLVGFPGYEWQLSIQMYGAGVSLLGCQPGKDYLRALFVVGHKANDDMAKLHRVNKGDVFEVSVVEVDEPPVKFGRILKRVLEVEKHVKAGELPECVEGRWPCAYFQLGECGGKPQVEVVRVEDSEFAQLCKEYTTAQADEKDAKKIREELKPKLEKWLAQRGGKAGEKFGTTDEAGNEYVFEWVENDVKEHVVKAGTRSFPQVKLVGGK